MNDTLSKKSKSYGRIDKVLTDYDTAVNSNPTLLAASLTFKDNYTLVKSIDVPERDATIPSTRYKNEKFAEFGEALLEVCNGLQLYADDTTNLALSGQVPTVISNLMEGDEPSQIARFRAILNAAQAITPAADLIPYGITASGLTALVAKLDELETLVDSARSAIDARMVKRQLKEKAFKNMDTFLATKLDLAVRTRKSAFPEFVAAYFLARKLHDQGGNTGEQEEETLLAGQPKLAMAMPTTEELQNALTPAPFQPVQNGNGVH